MRKSSILNTFLFPTLDKERKNLNHLPAKIEKPRDVTYTGASWPVRREEKDEAGRKKTELGAERERQSGIKQRHVGQMRDGDARQVAEQQRETVI